MIYSTSKFLFLQCHYKNKLNARLVIQNVTNFQKNKLRLFSSNKFFYKISPLYNVENFFAKRIFYIS
jgi:hypothetical protein